MTPVCGDADRMFELLQWICLHIKVCSLYKTSEGNFTFVFIYVSLKAKPVICHYISLMCFQNKQVMSGKFDSYKKEHEKSIYV